MRRIAAHEQSPAVERGQFEKVVFVLIDAVHDSREIEQAAVEPVSHMNAVAAEHVEADARTAGLDALHGPREVFERIRLGAADGDDTAHAGIVGAKFRLRLVSHVEDVLRSSQQEKTGIGEADAVVGTREEFLAKLCLQLVELLRHRRLCDVQPLCRARHAALAGHLHKIPQHSDFHVQPLLCPMSPSII